MDPDFNLAYVLMVSKPQKDPSMVENYHAISLLNNDLKLLSKLWPTYFFPLLTSMSTKIRWSSCRVGKVLIILEGQLILSPSCIPKGWRADPGRPFTFY